MKNLFRNSVLSAKATGLSVLFFMVLILTTSCGVEDMDNYGGKIIPTNEYKEPNIDRTPVKDTDNQFDVTVEVDCVRETGGKKEIYDQVSTTVREGVTVSFDKEPWIFESGILPKPTLSRDSVIKNGETKYNDKWIYVGTDGVSHTMTISYNKHDNYLQPCGGDTVIVTGYNKSNLPSVFIAEVAVQDSVIKETIYRMHPADFMSEVSNYYPGWEFPVNEKHPIFVKKGVVIENYDDYEDKGVRQDCDGLSYWELLLKNTKTGKSRNVSLPFTYVNVWDFSKPEKVIRAYGQLNVDFSKLQFDGQPTINSVKNDSLVVDNATQKVLLLFVPNPDVVGMIQYTSRLEFSGYGLNIEKVLNVPTVSSVKAVVDKNNGTPRTDAEGKKYTEYTYNITGKGYAGICDKPISLTDCLIWEREKGEDPIPGENSLVIRDLTINCIEGAGEKLLSGSLNAVTIDKSGNTVASEKMNFTKVKAWWELPMIGNVLGFDKAKYTNPRVTQGTEASAGTDTEGSISYSYRSGDKVTTYDNGYSYETPYTKSVLTVKVGELSASATIEANLTHTKTTVATTSIDITHNNKAYDGYKLSISQNGSMSGGSTTSTCNTPMDITGYDLKEKQGPTIVTGETFVSKKLEKTADGSSKSTMVINRQYSDGTDKEITMVIDYTGYLRKAADETRSNLDNLNYTTAAGGYVGNERLISSTAPLTDVTLKNWEIDYANGLTTPSVNQTWTLGYHTAQYSSKFLTEDFLVPTIVVSNDGGDNGITETSSTTDQKVLKNAVKADFSGYENSQTGTLRSAAKITLNKEDEYWEETIKHGQPSAGFFRDGVTSPIDNFVVYYKDRVDVYSGGVKKTSTERSKLRTPSGYSGAYDAGGGNFKPADYSYTSGEWVTVCLENILNGARVTPQRAMAAWQVDRSEVSGYKTTVLPNGNLLVEYTMNFYGYASSPKFGYTRSFEVPRR